VLTPAAIHQGVTTAILGTLGPSADPAPAAPWRTSRHPWDVFAVQRDSRQIEHHGFAVGLPTSRPVELRQRVGGGLAVETLVSVRWAHRLRADAASTDYDAALLAEAALMAVLALALHAGGAATPTQSFNLRITDITRTTTGDGLALLGEVVSTVLHSYIGD